MKQNRIIIEGWVYSSRQNGVVVSPNGISPVLCAGVHAGVETRILVRYETR